MGYTHYWSRPAVIPETIFQAIRIDFESLILPLADDGVQLAGAGGKGPPDISEELIRFNGLTECGHPKNDEIAVPYPLEDAEGIGPSSTAVANIDGLVSYLKHRTCNGSCSYETFSFPRSLDQTRRSEPAEDGLFGGYVKTGFRPYDVAVTAALIVAKRHLRDRLVIESNGGDPQWRDAKRICQGVLDYGDWFGITEEKIAEEWPGDSSRKREVLLRRLVELDPATLA
jgi:hypothetical protein